MKKLLILMLLIFGVSFLTTGCASVNEGMDKAKKPVKAVGKSAGKVLDVTGAVTDGAVDGISDSDYEDNPFNR